ncbi:hypothetical protein [Thiorhodococcus drewsii]|uniref:hypothetical protein n=1 Tax=Thiorhodococcus drewsii TaxID=210408 RepID=UPI001111C524|nr:hypothetical protein [Thiorhodococcus drewsii]
MRILLFIVIPLIAGLVVLAKKGAGQVTGKDNWKNASVKSEADDLMKKTAKGVSWMESQWEEAKREASEERNNQGLSRKRDE